MSENDETTNLARRAVACSAWRWMPRMLNDRGETVFRVNAQGVSVCSEGHHAYVRQAADALPDLADPATLGCLLALVREAWGCDDYRCLTIDVAGAGWCVIVRNGKHRPPSRARPGWSLDAQAHPLRGFEQPFGDNEFDTEAEALVMALEAATK